MGKRFIVVFFLASLFAIWFSASTVLVLKIRRAENGSTLYCAPVSSGEEIISDSMNSIYNVPVRERWRVREDGSIGVQEVVSSAAVMEYYHLDDFSSAGNGEYRGVPKNPSYHEILMKVGARGQQRLIVRGQESPLYQMVPEASTLRITVEGAPRLAACW